VAESGPDDVIELDQEAWQLPTRDGRPATQELGALVADNNVVVKTIASADGLRKIEVFERPDGSFGFEGYRFSREPLERSWIPYGFFASRFDSAAVAETEALERVNWSKLLDGMTVNERLYELDLVDEFDSARAAKDVEKVRDILVRARVDSVSIDAIVGRL